MFYFLLPFLFLELLFSGVLENNITAVYKQAYKHIKIENLTIQYYGKKFNQKIKFIDTSRIDPKLPQGMVKINNIKFAYFKLNAKIEVVKSTKIINKGERIDKDNCKLEWIPLKNLYRLPLMEIPKNGVARLYIPQNHLIFQYMVTTPDLVKRNSPIKVISKSGGIEMSFDATALQNGKRGDIIKVRDRQGNIYRVKIDEHGNGIL